MRNALSTQRSFFVRDMGHFGSAQAQYLRVRGRPAGPGALPGDHGTTGSVRGGRAAGLLRLGARVYDMAEGSGLLAIGLLLRVRAQLGEGVFCEGRWAAHFRLPVNLTYCLLNEIHGFLPDFITKVSHVATNFAN